jgi:hypothetical protein
MMPYGEVRLWQLRTKYGTALRRGQVLDVPGAVSSVRIVPATGERLTAEMIRSGVDIEIIELQFPPGKNAYVMLVPSHDPKTPIYIKLQLGGDSVIGRSFHYSNHPAANNEGDGNAE